MWPSHDAFGDDLASVGPAHQRDRAEPRGRCSSGTRLERLEQQLGDVVGVGGVLARVAGRVHARRAAEGVDLEAGVVGDARASRCGRTIAVALSRALPSSVSAVLDDVGHCRRTRQQLDAERPRIAAISATLSGLAVARTTVTTRGLSRRRTGGGGSESISSCSAKISLMPFSASPSRTSSSLARERHPLGGALHLDEPARRDHHHVHVDLGGRVLDVGKVEHGLAVDDADRDRRACAR